MICVYMVSFVLQRNYDKEELKRLPRGIIIRYPVAIFPDTRHAAHLNQAYIVPIIV